MEITILMVNQMKMKRRMTRVRVFLFFFITVISFIASLPIIALSFFNYKFCIFISHFWLRFFIYICKIILNIKINVEGIENLSGDEKFIIASKHNSAFETFFFAYFLKIPVFILKKSLFFIPIFGWALYFCKMAGIDRSNPKDVIKNIIIIAKDVFNQKRHLVIFPEGTRVAKNKKVNYKRGIITIAENMNYRILPVAHNSCDFFGRGFFDAKKSGAITFAFLTPLSFVDFESREQFMHTLESVIENKMKQFE